MASARGHDAVGGYTVLYNTSGSHERHSIRVINIALGRTSNQRAQWGALTITAEGQVCGRSNQVYATFHTMSAHTPWVCVREVNS